MRTLDKPGRSSTGAAGGFTLLEMMAVVLMIGLLLGYAAPNLGFSDVAKARAESRKVAALLEFARQNDVVVHYRDDSIDECRRLARRLSTCRAHEPGGKNHD